MRDMLPAARLACVLATLCVLAFACRDRGADGEGGAGGASSGTGAEGGAGGAAVESAAELADATVRGAAVSLSLAAPLFADGDQLYQEKDLATDNRARDLVENGVAGNSIVTDGGCVTFDWMQLTVVITFTGCQLETLGLPLDGVLTLSVTKNPTAFIMTFTDLMFGPTNVNGSVAVNFTGDGDMGRTTDAALTFQGAQGTTAFVLEDGRLSVDAAGAVTANGSGSIANGPLSATYGLTDVVWLQGDSCPSSGTLALDEASTPPMTITFLATTPVDGNVEIAVGPLPATTQALPFCAPL